MSNQSDRQFNINQAIEFVCKNFLDNYLKTLYSHRILNNDNIIEVHGQRKKEDSAGFILIRILINEENGEVLIPNIFVPLEDRGNNVGLGLLKMIFLISDRLSYNVCLVDLVDSFYDKMLQRGALQTELYDALQIVESTDLS